MSKQNAKIYRSMLEQTSRLNVNEEEKRVFVENLQNLLCAALVTENVPCVSNYQEDGLKLGFHLATRTHYCQGEDLERILSNFYQKKRLEEWNQSKELANNKEIELIKQELAECKSAIKELESKLQEAKESKEPVEEIAENTEGDKETTNDNTIEDASMPIYETIPVNRDIVDELLFVSWQGDVSRIGVTVEGKKFYVEAPEDKRQTILIRSAKPGSNIKLSFEGNVERIFWRWEENEAIQL